jgi:hypothetical protein
VISLNLSPSLSNLVVNIAHSRKVDGRPTRVRGRAPGPSAGRQASPSRFGTRITVAACGYDEMPTIALKKAGRGWHHPGRGRYSDEILTDTERQPYLLEFCEPFGSVRKQPDQNEGGLQNPMRCFNGLAQKPIGYRYTIRQELLSRFKP